jgi:uncharacterized protein (TIGR00730 family)
LKASQCYPLLKSRVKFDLAFLFNNFLPFPFIFMIEAVTIFCASSSKSPDKYFRAAEVLADILLDQGIGVVYGGGAIGLMGRIADRYIERNGLITGVIPEFMVKVEWAHPGVKNMLIVQDMHDRKKKLIENTDAVIALPGGTGTLEELLEVLALKRLGKYLNPIVFLNTDGFYNQLIDFFHTMVKEQFLRPEHLQAYTVVKDPTEVIPAIMNAPRWEADAIDRAPV